MMPDWKPPRAIALVPVSPSRYAARGRSASGISATTDSTSATASRQ